MFPLRLFFSFPLVGKVVLICSNFKGTLSHTQSMHDPNHTIPGSS